MEDILKYVIAGSIILVITPLAILYGYVFLGLLVKFIRYWSTWLDERVFKNIAYIVVLIPLSACAGLGQIDDVSKLSTTQLRSLSTIKTYQEDVGFKYTSLGAVKGLSCKGSGLSNDSSKDAALTQLKIKAVKKGANAILYPSCVNDASVDWGNNCWDSWVCAGEAIKR